MWRAEISGLLETSCVQPDSDLQQVNHFHAAITTSLLISNLQLHMCFYLLGLIGHLYRFGLLFFLRTKQHRKFSSSYQTNYQTLICPAQAAVQLAMSTYQVLMAKFLSKNPLTTNLSGKLSVEGKH